MSWANCPEAANWAFLEESVGSRPPGGVSCWRLSISEKLLLLQLLLLLLLFLLLLLLLLLFLRRFAWTQQSGQKSRLPVLFI